MAKDIKKSGRSEDIGKSKEIKNKKGSETTEIDPEEKKKRKLKPVHWVIIALVLALAATITYILWPEDDLVTIEDRGTALGQGGIVTPENVEEELERLGSVSPDAQYTVSMTTNWFFETWDTPSTNASVRNVERNSRTVYFDVILVDTGEVVYRSPYIPLGGELTNFALDRNLRAGSYDAIVTYFLVDDDYEIVTDVSVTVTLTVNQ